MAIRRCFVSRWPCLVALAAGMVAGDTRAEQPKEGQLKGKVVAAIEAIAGGSCPASLMAPVLLDACEQQLDRMRETLMRLGRIEDVKFKGIEHLPNGAEPEVYRVTFRNGSQLWMAYPSPDGKLAGLWTPGN